MHPMALDFFSLPGLDFSISAVLEGSAALEVSVVLDPWTSAVDHGTQERERKAHPRRLAICNNDATSRSRCFGDYYPQLPGSLQPPGISNKSRAVRAPSPAPPTAVLHVHIFTIGKRRYIRPTLDNTQRERALVPCRLAN